MPARASLAADVGIVDPGVVLAGLAALREDGLDVLGQPPRAGGQDQPFGRELLLLESDAGELGTPAPFVELSDSIVDLASGTDADGRRWIAVSTFSFE